MLQMTPPFRSGQVLLDHIDQTMRFYHPRCIDPSGGFFHFFNDDGSVHDRHTRHLLGSTCLVVHYAKAYRRFGNPAYLAAVRHGVAFLRTAHRNAMTGGYAWRLGWNNGSGKRIDGANHCRGLAFVLLAYAHALHAGVAESADFLQETFELMEKRFWQAQHGLYADQATPYWQMLAPYRGQNTNRHACAALLAAYQATGQRAYLYRAEQVAANITVRQAGQTSGFIWEHYHADWTPDWAYRHPDQPHLCPSPGYQPGHFTAWAKLLVQLERHRAALAPQGGWMLSRAVALFEAALDMGWDDANGGLCCGLAPDLEICDDDKHAWVQAESFAAAALLGARTGAPAYWDWYERIWTYSRQHCVAHRHGARGHGERRDIGDATSRAGKSDHHTVGACYDVLDALEAAP